MARNPLLQAMQLLPTIVFWLGRYGDVYRLGIEVATIAVICYIGFTDFRTFKISNLSIILLLLLCVLHAAEVRSHYNILLDALLGALVFAISLLFYSKGAIGGGDVKLLPLVCLWVGVHCAVLFSVLLLFFIIIHLAVVKIGWVATRSAGSRQTIAYAPAIAGAFLITVLTGCS